MKHKKLIIGILIVVCIAALLIGGFFIVRSIIFPQIKIENPFIGNGSSHTVTFDSQGGSNVESQIVRNGNPVVNPDTPLKEGFSFSGWYKSVETAKENEWSFNKDRVYEDITLYASWLPLENTEPTESLIYKREGDFYVVTGVGQETAVIIPSEYNGLPVRAIRGEHGTGALARKAIVTVVIPDSIVEIGQNAFSNCSDLISVSISENSALTTIGNNAFSGCSSLKNIYIPKNVTAIGDGAFNNCGAIDVITVAAENTAYSSEGNSLIEKVTNRLIRGSNSSAIPEGVAEIAPAAFRRANGITELSIPASVTEIGNYFIADSSITVIRYAGTQEKWNDIKKGKLWNFGNRNVEVMFIE